MNIRDQIVLKAPPRLSCAAAHRKEKLAPEDGERWDQIFDELGGKETME